MVARADPPYRPGLPALPLRRLHGRALPQAAGHGPDHGFGAELRRQQGRSDLRRPAQGLGLASRCGCCRRPRPSPRTCPRRWARRSRSSRRGRIGHAAAGAGRFASRSARSAMPRANHATAQTRVQCRAVDRLPAAPGAGAVRLRGQRHRHLGEDARAAGSRARFASRRGLDYFYADGLDLAEGYGQVAARGRTLPAHAPADLPAPAHRRASWAMPAPTSRSSGAASRS